MRFGHRASSVCIWTHGSPGNTKKENMSIITVANLKGGVGKTSLAINVACAFSKRFCETLLIDLDGQGDASYLLAGHLNKSSSALRPANPSHSLLERFSTLCKDQIVEVRPGLDLLPVTALRDLIPDGSLQTLAEHGEVLPRLIRNLSYDYDNIIIDTPPAWSAVHGATLSASDLAVVPIDPSEMSVRAAISFLNKASDTTTASALLVRTLVSRQARSITRQAKQKLEQTFLGQSSEDHLGEKIPQRVRLKGLTSQVEDGIAIYLSHAAIFRSEIAHKLTYEKKTVFEHKAVSHIAESYMQLASNIEKVAALHQPETLEPLEDMLDLAFA